MKSLCVCSVVKSEVSKSPRKRVPGTLPDRNVHQTGRAVLTTRGVPKPAIAAVIAMPEQVLQKCGDTLLVKEFLLSKDGRPYRRRYYVRESLPDGSVDLSGPWCTLSNARADYYFRVGTPFQRFRTAVGECLDAGEYPSGSAILRRLGRKGRDLSGKECRWREAVFEERGWRRRSDHEERLRKWEGSK